MANKSALVTGGTKGIGYAVSEMLASMGYDLYLTYHQDREAATLATQTLEALAPISVHTIAADGADLASINLIEQEIEKQGSIPEVLILNAGSTCRTSFAEMTPKEWEEVFMVNVHYPTFLIQRLAPRMLRGSSVIFTGSMMGVYPHGMSLAYGVTKSAVHGLVKNLVKHLEPHGIRVNGIAPGFVETEWQKNKPIEIRKNIEAKVALHRFAEPSEIADAYQFLITNSYMNGSVIEICGGYSYK